MSEAERRVVVTGVGPVTAVGTGTDALWDGLLRERSGIGAITRFDASPFKSRIGAEIGDFEPADHMDRRVARRFDRFSQFAVASARLALRDAGLEPSHVDPDRVAVQMGSALGGVAHAERQLGNFLREGVRAVDPRVALTTFGGAASCNISIEFGFTGPNATNAMSCASGAMAIGEAWRLIRDDMADVAIAGGVEAPLAPLSFGAFAIIRAMSSRNDAPEAACRPFDRHRDGFVMGEGACSLVLEEERHARARGARVYGRVLGYGTTADAHHMTAPRPDGAQAMRAMKYALDSAGMSPRQIDYINVHGSSTPLNDASETMAIRCVFGTRADEIPVSGTKPYYAHCLGASGAIEAGICALILRHHWIPPTLNLDEPEEGCDLDYVPHRGRTGAPCAILSNSFGFGGVNVSLVFGAVVDGDGRRPEDTDRIDSPDDTQPRR